MTDTEKKLLQAQHRLEEAQARDRVKERKTRTRRLIQKGAILEKVLPEVRTRTVCAGGLPDAKAAAARLNSAGRSPGNRGPSSFFSRRAHLLTTPKGRWYLPLASRALSEGDCGFCGSLQTMPQHLRVLLSSSARLGKYRRFN